jgi:hypothetical protein
MENVDREVGDTARATILFDIRDCHMEVSDVGALAHEANVKRPALNRLAPQTTIETPDRGPKLLQCSLIRAVAATTGIALGLVQSVAFPVDLCGETDLFFRGIVPGRRSS